MLLGDKMSENTDFNLSRLFWVAQVVQPGPGTKQPGHPGCFGKALGLGSEAQPWARAGPGTRLGGARAGPGPRLRAGFQGRPGPRAVPPSRVPI